MRSKSFRETLWFKKGELKDEAEDHVPLPIEDRYLDDGNVSREDSQLFSIRTGGTQYMRPVVVETEEVPGDLVALVVDLKRGRRPVIAMIGGAVAMAVAVAAICAF